ncbi:MAG: prolipoprotein diacylglyceryl transferase [Lachnospiraceae bacterium]|nr:prolipoprotein diacylglyceryl transferase [Lachnospiraceae bacterium]
MSDQSILFPNLHITLEHVGKNISIGGFSIAYYGIIIACGMILAMYLMLHEAKRVGIKQEDMLDIFIYAVIVGVVGARLYYVMFSWDLYKDNLVSIFFLRQGGLAIYGGVIGGLIAIFITCRIKKINFWKVTDLAAMGVLVGQICGRWGNFFNREVFGGYSDGLLAMGLPLDAIRSMEDVTEEMLQNLLVVDGVEFITVHPTFLYESLWNLGVLLFLLWYRKHQKFYGELFSFYLLLYGIGRFWIEGVRTDQLKIPGTMIPVSQVVAIIMIIGAFCYMVFMRKTHKQDLPTS